MRKEINNVYVLRCNFFLNLNYNIWCLSFFLLFPFNSLSTKSIFISRLRGLGDQSIRNLVTIIVASPLPSQILLPLPVIDFNTDTEAGFLREKKIVNLFNQWARDGLASELLLVQSNPHYVS